MALTLAAIKIVGIDRFSAVVCSCCQKVEQADADGLELNIYDVPTDATSILSIIYQSPIY